jgi:small subunit ribosomal protein S4
MIFKKKSHFKPLYKQFLKLRTNVQSRTKLFKFRHKKWKIFTQNYKKKLRRYRKFKPQNQIQYTVSRYPNKGNSYKRQFKSTLDASKRFRLFYGNLSKKLLKKKIRNLFDKKAKNFTYFNLLFLKLFEQRLDTIMYKSKFSQSFRNARQLIVHGKVFVNKTQIRSPAFILNPGDFITIDTKYHYLVEKNLKKAQIWPIPPKHLSINYKTLEIFFGTTPVKNYYSTDFLFHLDLEKVIINYYRQ